MRRNRRRVSESSAKAVALRPRSQRRTLGPSGGESGLHPRRWLRVQRILMCSTCELSEVVHAHAHEGHERRASVCDLSARAFATATDTASGAGSSPFPEKSQSIVTPNTPAMTANVPASGLHPSARIAREWLALSPARRSSSRHDSAGSAIATSRSMRRPMSCPSALVRLATLLTSTLVATRLRVNRDPREPLTRTRVTPMVGT